MQTLVYYLTTAMATGLFTAKPSKAYSVNGAEARDIPIETRHYWMRRANAALFEVTGNPCPTQAFGTVIVNHTAGGLGELVCIGANDVASGNPTLHGETAAITNCSAILTDPNGPYKLSGHEALKAWADLTLYTNAEPCPMCASAIRWSGFKELVFGTGIKSLRAYNWKMMTLPAKDLFKYTTELPTGRTTIAGGVLENETDPYFKWQYTRGTDCPPGCKRKGAKCASEVGSTAKSEQRDAAGVYWGWQKRGA
ncbi:nucleoside deaminase [Metarhizium acridum CQMa 102]|uniref:Nucleoside deaminase n=2 Tax=Metarhizium acridum TaxID=92637 RepID=E9EBP9_METAQ|nr:nucleoside deaminase [Metarhizium acridum CQMa 102]EFY86699.1 nucleoside deaminase [Metarhizium acridum CQMa 102]